MHHQFIPLEQTELSQSEMLQWPYSDSHGTEQTDNITMVTL